MVKSLYAKFAIILIVVFSITGISFSVFAVILGKDYLQQVNNRALRDLANNIVTQRNLISNNQVDSKALKQTFHHYMTVNPNLEFYLLDLTGKILTFSAEPGKVKRLQVNLAPIKGQLAGDVSINQGDDPRSISGFKPFSVAAIPNAQNPEAYLYIILESQAVDKISQDLADVKLFRLVMGSLAVSLIIGLIVGLGLFYGPAQRLKLLSEHMLRFRDLGYNQSPENLPISYQKKGDEIASLHQSYQLMAEHIAEQMRQLKKQDQLRRQMIASISHDLRTPLASIYGYIEMLHLKGDDLASDAKQQYLQTALNGCEQLRGLIDDLFELAKLEARETPPHIEPFSISELILDVADKFKLQAKQQNIQLAVQCQPDFPLVFADISLIERALNNLIANALAHNKPGGSVEIEVLLKQSEQNSKIISQDAAQNRLEPSAKDIEVRIKDNGKGIAKEHLEHIFERFYQVDNQHREGSNAGLGLAITKRIVELHGQMIQVQSKLNQGTCFSFHLPTVNIYV